MLPFRPGSKVNREIEADRQGKTLEQMEAEMGLAAASGGGRVGRAAKSKEEQMADKGLWRKNASGKKRKRYKGTKVQRYNGLHKVADSSRAPYRGLVASVLALCLVSSVVLSLTARFVFFEMVWCVLPPRVICRKINSTPGFSDGYNVFFF